jgi:hypothetical protein
MPGVAVDYRCQPGCKILDTRADLVGVAGFEPTAPRSQSLSEQSEAVGARAGPGAERLVRTDRSRRVRGSLLHGCYMARRRRTASRTIARSWSRRSTAPTSGDNFHPLAASVKLRG